MLFVPPEVFTLVLGPAFDLPCFLATAILDSFSLFCLPNTYKWSLKRTGYDSECIVQVSCLISLKFLSELGRGETFRWKNNLPWRSEALASNVHKVSFTGMEKTESEEFLLPGLETNLCFLPHLFFPGPHHSCHLVLHGDVCDLSCQAGRGTIRPNRRKNRSNPKESMQNRKEGFQKQLSWKRLNPKMVILKGTS